MTIETLVNQPAFPFPRFLQDRHHYDLSRDFWDRSFLDGLADKTDRTAWAPWMQNPFFDGLPIWSVVNKKEGRGIVVQQRERSEDEVWFKCWLNESIDDTNSKIPYLFVETFVSTTSYKLFSELVRSWTAEHVQRNRFSDFTDVVQKRATAEGPPLV